MPDDFVDLTVTSPPYDDMDENFNPISKNGMRDYNDYEWDFKKIANELFRVTKIGGVVVWVVNDPTIYGSESLASSLQKIFFRRVGFNIHDTMIYNKNGFRYPFDKLYHQVYEYMIVLSRNTPKTFNHLMDRKIIYTKKRYVQNKRQKDGSFSRRSGYQPGLASKRYNIWSINPGGKESEDKIEHPGFFPEALARDHIYSWSNEGDLVYDPFIGSGTTSKMAHLMKRNWIGSEISQEYVDLANKRLEKYLNQTDLFAPEKANGREMDILKQTSLAI